MGISKLKILVLFILYNFSILSCQNKKMEEKYSWSGTISAPQEYPMEIYSDGIIANDFTYPFDAIWGTQNTGWGNEGSKMNVSTKKMEIPHHLEFTWYSLVEEKFYTGKWNLDQIKIQKLFEEGFIDSDTGKKQTYTTFKIGLAPKGKLVLWINAPGIQKEIGVFQAHDTIVTKMQAYENAQYMFENDYAKERLMSDFLITSDVKNRLSSAGYPSPSVYENFRKKYLWRPIIELPSGYKVKKIFFMACNGEYDTYTEHNEKKAIPYYLAIVICDSAGKEMGVNLFFTKDENYYEENILKGNNVLPTDFDLNDMYKTFAGFSQTEPMDILIKVNPEIKSADVSLKQKETVIQLKNFISKIY